MASDSFPDDLGRSAQPFDVSWTTIGRLAEERASWRELADCAIEPNPLYAPNVLIATERHLRGGKPIPAVVIRDPARDGALAGLAPVEALGWRNGFPGRACGLFVNPYTTLTHPLIRRDGAVAILRAMLRFLAHEGQGAVIFPFLTEKRGFFRALDDAAGAEGYALARVDGLSRPAIEPDPGASGEQYARTYIRKNRRSSTERRMRRLTDIGTVGFSEAMANGPGGREALEAFLRLESAGWKGASGTALACRDATRAFALEAFGGADDAPRVRLRTLTLDGRPIAMALDLESQGVGYAFKAAYDPAYARHAPGLALDARTAASVGGGFAIERLDSLAQVEIAQEGVWRQREPVGRYVLSLSREASAAETLARRMRAAADVKSRAKLSAAGGRAIVRSGLRAAKDYRLALALFLIGASLPMASLLTQRGG